MATAFSLAPRPFSASIQKAAKRQPPAATRRTQIRNFASRILRIISFTRRNNFAFFVQARGEHPAYRAEKCLPPFVLITIITDANSTEVIHETIRRNNGLTDSDFADRANCSGAGVVAALGARTHCKIAAPQRMGYRKTRWPQRRNADRLSRIERKTPGRSDHPRNFRLERLGARTCRRSRGSRLHRCCSRSA